MNNQNGLPAATPNDRIHSLASNVKEVAEHLSTAAATVKNKASEAKAHVVSSARPIVAKAGRAIKEHPIMAVGLALGVGYLVMRLIRR